MPKVSPILTDAALKGAVDRAKRTEKMVELSDGKVTGLRAGITPAGKVAWALAMQDQWGSPRKYLIIARGLDNARRVASEMRDRVLKGADPHEERKHARHAGPLAKVGIGTFDAVLNTYAAQIGRTKRSWDILDKSIRRVFKSHLEGPFAGLTVKGLQRTIDAHPGTQSCAYAVRAVRPVLKWAEKHVDAFPTGLWALEPPPSNKPRTRVLTPAEVAKLLPILRGAGTHGKALAFMLLTCARKDEVCSARWVDVVLDDKGTGVWAIPQNKSDVEHRVPLSRQAVMVIGKSGVDDAFVFASRQGTKLGNWDRQTKAIQELAGVSGFHRHDLRRTAATTMGELEIDPYVIRAALGHVHVKDALETTYNRARYFPKVREALDALAWKWWPLARSDMPDTPDTIRYGQHDGTDDVDIAASKDWVPVATVKP